MLEGEDRLEYERQVAMYGTTATVALLTIAGSFVYFIFLAVQILREHRSLLDLQSGPIYFALLAFIFYSGSKRRLERLEEIRKKSGPNPAPEPPAPSRGGSA